MKRSEPDGQFEALLEFLKSTRGFDFTGYKRASVGRRIRKRMHEVSVRTFADYQDYLEVHPEEYSFLFDTIIINAFEVVGEQTDGKYWAILDDIYPVVNIERPMSRSQLQTLLSGAYPFFYSDESTEGAYFYDPSKRPS